MKSRPWLAVAVVLPRLVALLVNQDLAGDAIPRAWLAHRWLQAPHLITHFHDGAMQFGQLHVYVLALSELLWPSLPHAGRVASLVLGCLTAWPLAAFTARRFGSRAAAFAVLGFAFWGLHVQASTTGPSEALTLLLVMGTVALFDVATSRPSAWWGAAGLLNLACATRYDPWLWVPLLAAVEWHRTKRLSRGVAFGAASSVFAVLWLLGNQRGVGDAFFPIRFIDQFHRDWWPAEAALWGETNYRLICALFWPGAALLTLSPFLALPAFAMVPRAWRERPELRWLVVLVVLPAALYSVRAAVMGSFAPLARFTMKEVLLLLPLAGWGADRLAQRWPWTGRALVGGAAAWCLALGQYCYEPDTKWSFTLRAISPTLRLEQPLRGFVESLAARTRAAPGTLVVDEDPRAYDDLVVSFYSGLPFDEQVRRRYDRYAEALAGRTPRWLVLFEGGRLAREGAAVFLSDERVRFQGHVYERRAAGRASVFELLGPG